MKRTYTFILFFILIFTGVDHPRADNLSTRNFRSFKTSTLDSLRQDPGLRYKEPPAFLGSLLNDLMTWLISKLTPYMATKTAARTIRIISYLLALWAVIVIIRYLVKGDGNALFGKTETAPNLPIGIAGEDIYALDLRQLLVERVNGKQYREAVRILYLINLKALADRGEVNWRKGKTNLDYLNELRGKEHIYRPFRDLTRVFEFIWYGNEEINSDTYRDLNTRFSAFSREDNHA